MIGVARGPIGDGPRFFVFRGNEDASPFSSVRDQK